MCPMEGIGDAAQLAHTLGDVIGHRENLAAMLIEQEMVVPKVGPLMCQ
jgi:hypothetical protein